MTEDDEDEDAPTICCSSAEELRAVLSVFADEDGCIQLHESDCTVDEVDEICNCEPQVVQVGAMASA